MGSAAQQVDMPQPTLNQLFAVSSAKASSGNVAVSQTVTGNINEDKAAAVDGTGQRSQL